VDTVERFQGGEPELIIASATVSGLAYAQSESDFLLQPRRLTVAVSRPKRKLIVLASQALFTLIPADLDDYERGVLWKHLRHGCASPPLWTGEYGGYRLRVLAIKMTETPPILVLDSEDRHRSEAIAGREMHHQPGRTAW
jgi:AAA domain-containing protein